MGAFNTLIADADCLYCGHAGRFDIQFKFGDVWQHDYRIGDALRWDRRTNYGEPDHARVLVSGISSTRCEHCGRGSLNFVIIVADNILSAARSIPEEMSDEFVYVD